MHDPSPDLPAETDVSTVRFPTRIRNALAEAGFKTIGEVRAASDVELKRLVNLGSQSVEYLRKML